jgi:hypothetical protein
MSSVFCIVCDLFDILHYIDLAFDSFKFLWLCLHCIVRSDYLFWHTVTMATIEFEI